MVIWEVSPLAELKTFIYYSWYMTGHIFLKNHEIWNVARTLSQISIFYMFLLWWKLCEIHNWFNIYGISASMQFLEPI